jgi:hypothetical protein
MKLDEAKRRRGPALLDTSEKRNCTVSARHNAAELERLDAMRASVQMQRGEYLRAAALHRLPPTVPALNREAWAELARLAANINQYQLAINEHRATGYPPEVLNELRTLLQDFRRNLLGLQEDHKKDHEG